MTSWADRLGVFDLETTGVDVERARIVTACIAVLDADGEVVDRWDWLADPGVEIPEAASEVHGITTEQARAEGRPSGVVVAEITQTLRTLFSLGVPVVVYNAPYDLSLLDRECRRNELEPLVDPTPVIDPLVLDKAVDRYRKGKRTLEAAAARYGVTLDDAHDAGADAIAAGRVARALLAAYPDDLDLAVADLHGRQVVWYAEQAARFQDYIRRQKGDESFTASTAWPVKYPAHPGAYRDTQPIPPLEPRLGRVPVIDFSRPLGLQLAAPPSAPPAPPAVDAGPPDPRGAYPGVVPNLTEPPALEEAPEADQQPGFEDYGPPAPEDAVDVGPDAGDGDAGDVDAADGDADGAGRSDSRPAVLRIAAAIVTDPEGRSLLVRKAGTTHFMQPGGKIEEGESAIDALTRELAEEIGVELDTASAEYLGLFRAVAANEADTVVLAAVFALSIAHEVVASGEIEELLWVDDPDLLEVDVAPLTRDELLPLWERRRVQLF
ncbi:exonuclease domain-containing protein [Protaetiibacter larvae]|uniref:exonuclease domain-containing protein n=1 Tax=Protaetiibacter larvae TaxID=2592654 RepID=UPI001AEF8529